ncbi:MAG: hypothetical protein ACJAUD_001180 [Crocinitomicaceae bacterium]|jgi:hypothetical protein
MKTSNFLAGLFISCSLTSFSQITSNPGTNNWTSPSAWMGGVVPSASDDVIIGNNSTIVVDISLVHNANIDINGGVLTSINPTNDLTVNSANITITGPSSLNFIGTGAAVPVTINNGHLINAGLYMAGDTYISFSTTGTISSNDGMFTVAGDLTIDDNEIFENNLEMGVNGTMQINVDAEYYNNMYASATIVSNDGLFENLGSFSASDNVINNAGAEIITDGTGMSVTNGVQNQGEIYVLDSLQIGTDLDNLLGALIYCDSGSVNIGADFYNEGSVSGDGGYYYIAGDSENALGGVIDGSIDVCDATLLPSTHLDTDDGWQTVDFNTVTFCSSSLASIDDNIAEPRFEVYPNPANEQVSINGIDQATVSIVTNDGRVISVNEISKSNNTIDINSIPGGVYFILVDQEGKVFTEKLIKL